MKDKCSSVKPNQVYSRRSVAMKRENPCFKVSRNDVTNLILADEHVVNAANSNLTYVTDLFETKPHVLTAKLKPDNDYRENMQMNSADAYLSVPVGRPTFNKRNMRNDKRNMRNDKRNMRNDKRNMRNDKRNMRNDKRNMRNDKRNMRNDKPNSQNNEIKSDVNYYYRSRRSTNSTAESSEVALR